MATVCSLAPRRIDRGDVQWHLLGKTGAGKCRSCSWWKTGQDCSFSLPSCHKWRVFVKR